MRLRDEFSSVAILHLDMLAWVPFPLDLLQPTQLFLIDSSLRKHCHMFQSLCGHLRGLSDSVLQPCLLLNWELKVAFQPWGSGWLNPSRKEPGTPPLSPLWPHLTGSSWSPVPGPHYPYWLDQNPSPHRIPLSPVVIFRHEKHCPGALLPSFRSTTATWRC